MSNVNKLGTEDLQGSLEDACAVQHQVESPFQSLLMSEVMHLSAWQNYPVFA